VGCGEGGCVLRNFIRAAAVCAALSACASAGTKVDPSTAQQFQKGSTTYSEVVAALGEPTTVTTASDGKKTAAYSYAKTTVRPESFIPYVGAFVGGADVKTSAVIFRFDGADKLIDFSTSVSNTGAGYGLETK